VAYDLKLTIIMEFKVEYDVGFEMEWLQISTRFHHDNICCSIFSQKKNKQNNEFIAVSGVYHLLCATTQGTIHTIRINCLNSTAKVISENHIENNKILCMHYYEKSNIHIIASSSDKIFFTYIGSTGRLKIIKTVNMIAEKVSTATLFQEQYLFTGF